MVSRPTHKPIPIPLSVPVQDDETFDSVDDLLASIRELVSPGAVDIIDLNRPVQPEPDVVTNPVTNPGQTQQSGLAHSLSQPRKAQQSGSVQSRRAAPPVYPDRGAQTNPVQPGPDVVGNLGQGQNDLGYVYDLDEQEVCPSPSLAPHMKRHLSEKTRSESTKVLSSLISALEDPDQALDADTDSSAPGFQQAMFGHKGGRQVKGLCVEDLVAQCLKAPLGQWIAQNDALISQHVKTMIDHHITELLHQWLDVHLPELIKASVDQHLDALIQSVRKQQTP